MRKYTYFLFISFMFFLFSCTGCPAASSTSSESSEEPVYTPDVVWTLETNVYAPVDQPTQYGKYLYCTESNWLLVDSDAEHYFDVVKIDLATGSKIWSTSTLPGRDNSDLVKGGDYIFLQTTSGLLYAFDDEDGALAATVSIEKTFRNKLGTMLYCNGNLFWSNICCDGIHNEGLLELKMSDIDFTKDPAEEQNLQPVLIWHDETDEVGMMITPIAENGIIYFQTYDYYGKATIKTGAIYADTGKIKWIQSTNIMNGSGFKSMYIVGNRLYVIANHLGCLNLETGESIYEISYTDDELKTEKALSAGPFLYGASYYDGKFYFTNMSSWSTSSYTGIPEQFVSNIQCMDAASGKLVWGDLPADCGSLGTRPIVENDKVFVTAGECGLRVYNAQNGKLIGVDKTVRTFGEEANAQYGGLVMYFNLRSDHTSTLTAIRP